MNTFKVCQEILKQKKKNSVSHNKQYTIKHIEIFIKVLQQNLNFQIIIL